MSKIPVRVLSSAILLLGLVGGARSQDSTDRPLGDVAREQRELRKQPKAEKVYGNKKDVAPASSPDNSDSTSLKSAEAKSAEVSSDAGKVIDAKAGGTEAAKAETPVSRTALDGPTMDRPRMDRPKDGASEKADDLLIVPEGTRLTIDVSGAKVVVPVRVGFAMAIPALSKATVRVSQRGTGDSVYLAELTDVTVEGVRYSVVTDQVPVSGPETLPSEVTFTLLKQISIQR